MKSRLIALASALVVVAFAAPAAQAATSVVISQASFGGPGGGNDEVIEIRNVSAAAIDISGWTLWGSNSAGTASARATVPAGTSLPAGKTFVFANSNVASNAGDVLYGTGITNTGGIQIRNGSTVMDAFGSPSAPAAYREGAGIAQPSSGPGGFVRKNGGTQDTDDNVADFTGPTTLTPTVCGSACTGGSSGQPCEAVDGIVPITSIQTLTANAACNGSTVTVKGIVTGVDDLYGSTYDAIYESDAGFWLQNATRDPQAKTSSALFVEAVQRPADIADFIGREVTIKGRVETKFGLVALVPSNVIGSTSNPNTQDVTLASTGATVSTDKKPLPAPVVLDKTLSDTQNAVDRPYYRSLQGMRVTLPVGIATGGGTTKFRDVFVEPGTTATRLFRKNDQPAIDTPWSDAPAELGIMPDGGAHNPADPRLSWFSDTQVNLDLFDVVRNVTGPLSYSYSFYKIMPQLTDPAPTIERGPINAAYPPAAPTPAANTLRVASFNVENYFPVGKENDGHTITQAEYNERTAAIVSAIRKLLKEPDVIAVQEIAVFADGANALTGLAAALGNYTPYIATNNDGRGIAPGFLVKDGTTATGGKVVGASADGPWTGTGQCDLYAPNAATGDLFDRAPYQIDIKKGDIALTALSNHWASQSHQNQCRIDEANWVRGAAADLQAAGKNVLVAGDLNDFQFSAALSALTQGNVLTNLWSKAPEGLAYSYKFNGHLQTLDHIAVTAGLASRVSDMRYIHLDNDVYERYTGTSTANYASDTSQGVGISDHDPPVVTFDLAKGASTSTDGTITGTVPATLALTLGTAGPLGPFVPGVAKDYTTTMTATVTSTGEDAALSVIDPSATATGRLVNGTHALAAPLQVSADGGAFAPLRTDNGPLALTSWATPVTLRDVQLGFKQSIGGTEGLRTGSYSKTLTFTLSTTNP